MWLCYHDHGYILDDGRYPPLCNGPYSSGGIPALGHYEHRDRVRAVHEGDRHDVLRGAGSGSISRTLQPAQEDCSICHP